MLLCSKTFSWRLSPPVPLPELRSVLKAHYGLEAKEILPLNIEHAPGSLAAKVETHSGQTFFLKFKREIAPGALAVASFLHSESFPVLAPLPSLHHELSVRADRFFLVLYPFLNAHPVDPRSLVPTQWQKLGQILHRIHETPLPGALLHTLPHASFVPWGEAFLVECSETYVRRGTSLRRLWETHERLLKDFFSFTWELGQAASLAAPALHLCHNDFHSDNILLDASSGDLTVIDWDNSLWGLRERDLLFIGPEHRPAFEVGYGPVHEVPEATRYVRADWLLQDLFDCFSRLLSPELSGREHVWLVETVADIIPRMSAFRKQ